MRPFLVFAPKMMIKSFPRNELRFMAMTYICYVSRQCKKSPGIAQNAIIRVYSKSMKDYKTRIRLEKQEYPGTTLALAFEQKINHNHSRWSGGE